MAGKQVTQTIKFNFEGDISNLRGSIGQIEQKMQNIKLPKVAEKGINSDLQKLKTELSKLESKTKGGIIKLDDTGSIQRSGERIKELYTSLTNKVKDLGNVSDKELKNLFPPEIVQKIDNARAAMDKYEKEIKETNAELKKQEKELERLQGARDKKKTEFKSAGNKKKITDQEYDDLTRQKKYQQGQSTRTKNQIDSMRAQYDKLATKAGTNKDGTINKRGLSDEDKQFAKTYEELAVKAQKATAEVEKLNKKINESIKISKYNELEKEFNESEQQAREAEQAVTNLKNKINQSFTNFKGNLDLGIDPSKLQDIKAVEAAINGIGTEEIDRLRLGFDGLGKEVDELEGKVSDTGEKISGEFSQAANSAMSMRDQFNQLSTNIQYFFGIANGIQLFKRTLREALQTVKELDAAMVKIAVVSDYDMSDMWSTLPEFTKRANELGVAITEVYDATGLYVQQGLDLVESQGLANETLKMAKIAGMDAAAATDAMTSALRGFNLELNQGSAERVNDIYSKLAAITASDTQEIATAMSKTASIANNAGASIENTSAFLSMIIETTRESAETAGTALKTVIARFSELKKNPAEIGDVDGEIVDANQIESALRLAGVDLRDAAGQFRNFDEVIIELSGKWDTLDKNTQRYIATMAAGSRQQSRFLALMSDSERLAQLTDAAYNSAGASTKQFNKTLESLESKMNRLKNAWDTFTQSLANNELIKFGVDLLTDILTIINSISEAFSGLGSIVGTVLSTTMIAAFFMLAQKGVNALLAGVASGIGQFGAKVQTKMQEITNESAVNGTNAGNQYATNFINAADSKYKTWYTKLQKRMGYTNAPNTNTPTETPTARDNFKSKYGQDFTQYSQLQSGKGKNKRIYDRREDGTWAVSDRKGNPLGGKNHFLSEKEMEQQLANGVKPAIRDYEKLGHTVSGVGTAMMGLGMVTSLVAQEFRKVGDEKTAKFLEEAGGWITGIGSALMLLAPIIKMVGGKTRAELIKTGKTAMKWAGIMLLIVSVISLIKTVGEAIAKNTPEGKLKALSEATERAAEEAQKAQEAYSNWLSDKNEYNGLIEAIKETTKGTAAWSEQMDKLQDKVYEMINTYPELAQYLKEDGTFTEKGIQAYNEKLKNEKELKMGMKMTAQVAEDTQRYENERNNLTEEREKELSKYSKDSAKYKEKEAYYDAKQTELDNTYKATTAGAMNYMAQGAGVEGYMSDNISAAMSVQGYADKMAKRVQQRKEAIKGGYDNEQMTEEVGLTAAGIGVGALALGVANIWNPLGWISLGVAVVGGITAGIGAALSGASLEELQEKYSEAFGIPVEEISEDIKDDADALASAIAEKEIYEEFQKDLKAAEAQLFSLGANTQKLLANDLSLLDQDFSEFGGFEKWVESLKDGVNGLADGAIDDTLKEFKEKTKETVDSIDRIFSGKVKFKYQIVGEEIVENEVSGLIMSGVDGGRLAAAEKSLQETFGDNTTNALNSVMQSYADNQVSVNELTGAYIELGNAVTITQKAVAAKKMFETGTQNIKTLAATFMVAEANALSATNQIKEFYMNLSADQMNEIFKNGMTTAQSIMEMGASFTDLNGIVDTTGINFATLSDVLNDVKSGILSVDDLTQGFVETLDKLNKADHIVEDTLARIATFKEPTSGRTIGEKFGEVSKKLSDLILEGRYGDPALEAYFDFMFGEDAWNNALKEAEYDAEKAMLKYSGIIQTLADDVKFFDVWKNTASNSGGLWSVDDNSIVFDFKEIDNFEHLVARIEEVTGWSQQFIESALADAQIWSKDLKYTIESLQQVDALNTYLNNLKDINGKITLDEEQLKKIYADGFEGKSKFKSDSQFIAFVEEQVKGAGYTVETVSDNISAADRVNNLYSNFSKENKVEGFIQDIVFSDIVKEGGENISIMKAKQSKRGGAARLRKAANTLVNEEFSKEEFDQIMKEWGWNLSPEESENFYKKAKSQYTKHVQKGISIDNGYYVINREKADSFTLSGTEIDQNKAVDNYTKMLQEAYQTYKLDGLSSLEAAERVRKELGTKEKMATAFGQNAEAFDDTELYKKLSNLVDSSSGEMAKWMTEGVSQEEANMINQADLINQGTIKAIDYLIASGALPKNTISEEALEKLNSGEYTIDSKKILNAVGVNKSSNNTGGSGGSSEKRFNLTADMLGVKGVDLSKAYNLTAEEAKKIARSALEQIDFDWMHNFNELGEKITRTLDKLSTEFDLAVKTLSKSSEELTQNLVEQYANMEAEALVSQAKADAAQQRMQGMLAKNSDLTKYTWYEDGMVKINYDKINADKADYNMTEKTGILLDELVSLAEVINENEQTQLDVDMKQAEFLEEITNTVIDFENQVRDMVIEQYEQEIDKLEQIDSAINDANSKLIASIQKSLDRFRQDRENEKTEKDIEDKQRRLALLRADTTGANRGAIMSLEKEIGEAQEDYTDTLIDQKISALQEQNEEASAQRQEQIDIANDQLNSAKENGKINEEVARLLSADGFKGSALEQLWMGRMENKGLDKTEWDTELRNMEKQFVEYKSSTDFQNMFKNGGINDDLSKKIKTAIGDINTTVQNALRGYRVLSQDDIQTIVNGIGSKLPTGGSQDGDEPDKEALLKELYISSGMQAIVKNAKAKGGSPVATQGFEKALYAMVVGSGGKLGTETYAENAILDWMVSKGYINLGKRYATGGLNTQTGPAWLDGTPSKPELVLNAQDTQNFLQLKDILSSIMSNGTFSTTPQNDGTINLEIYLNVEQGLSNDYDVEQLVTKVKQEIARVGQERNIQILTKR